MVEITETDESKVNSLHRYTGAVQVEFPPGKETIDVDEETAEQAVGTYQTVAYADDAESEADAQAERDVTDAGTGTATRDDEPVDARPATETDVGSGDETRAEAKTDAEPEAQADAETEAEARNTGPTTTAGEPRESRAPHVDAQRDATNASATGNAEDDEPTPGEEP